MWISRREMARLVKQLKRAERRATELERALLAERERNRVRENELLNRCLTAAGCYALPAATPTKMATQASTEPREMTALEEAIRDAYRQAATEAGHSRQEADAMFEKRRRGEAIIGDEPFTLIDG
jgi:hypothetical protein